MYELLIIFFWNKIYPPLITSLYSIIQSHTIDECTWLFRNKPIYKQEWISSLKIRYAKRGIIDGTVNVLGFMLAINYVFFLTKIFLSWAGIEPRTVELPCYHITLYSPHIYQLRHRGMSYLLDIKLIINYWRYLYYTLRVPFRSPLALVLCHDQLH